MGGTGTREGVTWVGRVVVVVVAVVVVAVVVVAVVAGWQAG